MALREPSVSLPSLVSSSSPFNLLVDITDDDDDNDDAWSEQINRSGQFQVQVNAVHDDTNDHLEEAPSMTLRDILLQADTTQFDLLGKTFLSGLCDGS